MLHCSVDGLESTFQLMMLLWKERRDDKLKSSAETPADELRAC